jgi:galactokinase
MSSSSPVTVRAPIPLVLLGDAGGEAHLRALALATQQTLTLTVRPSGESHVDGQWRSPGGAEVRLEGEAWRSVLVRAGSELERGRGASIEIEGEPMPHGLDPRAALAVGAAAGLDALWGSGLTREAIAGVAAGRDTDGRAAAEAVAFARAGALLQLEAEPPGREAVAFAGDIALVVCGALTGGPEPREAWKERTLGARLAAALLCEMIGIDASSPPRLADVAGWTESELLVEELPVKASPAWVSKGTGILGEALAALPGGGVNARDEVPVRRYARHLLSEADRVTRAQQAIARGDLGGFGALLNESDESLVKDWGRDSAELAAACHSMRRAGASGARGSAAGSFAAGAIARGSLPEFLERLAADGLNAFEVQPSGAYEVATG